MKNLNKFAKVFMFLACLSGSLWVGSYLTRLFVSYQLFQERDFILKDYINEHNIEGILTTLLPAFITTIILYSFFIISFIVFLVSSKINLKQNGWLFIVTILVLITFPFEIYLMTIDYNILLLLIQNNFSANDVLSLIISRFKQLSSFPIIHILCYFSIIFLVVFQPLKAETKQK